MSASTASDPTEEVAAFFYFFFSCLNSAISDFKAA